MHIGEKIRELRKDRGMHQKELATFCNVKQNTVSSWERGVRIPPLPAIEKMATFFKVPISEIVQYNVEYTHAEKELLSDLEGTKKATELTVADLKEKYNFVIDGREATKEEIEGAIAYIRTLRSMDK